MENFPIEIVLCHVPSGKWVVENICNEAQIWMVRHIIWKITSHLIYSTLLFVAMSEVAAVELKLWIQKQWTNLFHCCCCHHFLLFVKVDISAVIKSQFPARGVLLLSRQEWMSLPPLSTELTQLTGAGICELRTFVLKLCGSVRIPFVKLSQGTVSFYSQFYTARRCVSVHPVDCSSNTLKNPTLCLEVCSDDSFGKQHTREVSIGC